MYFLCFAPLPPPHLPGPWHSDGRGEPERGHLVPRLQLPDRGGSPKGGLGRSVEQDEGGLEQGDTGRHLFPGKRVAVNRVGNERGG